MLSSRLKSGFSQTVLLSAAALLVVTRAESQEPGPSPVMVRSEFMPPVSTGASSVKLNALLQAWAVDDTTSAATQFNFRPRRAELKASVQATPETRLFLMIDPAKSLKIGTGEAAGTLRPTNDNKILQDLGVAFRANSRFEFMAGQFKVPTIGEALESSSELIFVERSFLARAFGDRREPGVMTGYKDDIVALQAMVSNGHGANVDDQSNAKDFNGRVQISPGGGFRIGAFVTLGDFKYAAKGRTGIDLLWKGETWTFRVLGVSAKDKNVSSRGVVADAAYMATSWLQPALRYEIVRSGTLTAQAPTVGMNFLVDGPKTKVQVGYSYLDGFSGSQGSPVLAEGKQGSLLAVNFQAAI